MIPKNTFLWFSKNEEEAVAGFQVYLTSSKMMYVYLIQYKQSGLHRFRLKFFSYYYEKPDYDRARFLSDIGGAAGLILGMSIASILGFIDCILIYFLQFISKIFRYCKKSLYRNVAKVSLQTSSQSVLRFQWNVLRNWICLRWSSLESSQTKNHSDLKIFVFKLRNQKVGSTPATQNDSLLKFLQVSQTNEITFRLNYIKICSYNVKYIVKAMPPKLDSHNPWLSDNWNKECTCTLYKYAIDSKLENLFSFEEFTVWAYSDLMWY